MTLTPVLPSKDRTGDKKQTGTILDHSGHKKSDMTKITDYSFNVNISNLIVTMKAMGKKSKMA